MRLKLPKTVMTVFEHTKGDIFVSKVRCLGVDTMLRLYGGLEYPTSTSAETGATSLFAKELGVSQVRAEEYFKDIYK
ncbi:MAG: hypothetical protein QXI19_11760 [Candidatus Caldarchaeum sp.]